MATADLNRLMDDARVRLPGALDDAILRELFATMREFFKLSNAWRECIDFTYTGNRDCYNITPFAGRIVRLIGVENTDHAWVNATMPSPGELHIGSAPNGTTDLKAWVVLTVADPVTKNGMPILPEWVLAKYGDAFLEGLLGRMMFQLAKPYTNAQMAEYHLRRFRNEIATARVETNHNNVYRGQSWQFPPGFGSRRVRG